RATTLKMSDMASRISATSDKADRCRSVLASENSLARRLDIVWAGAKREERIWLLLPITNVTAIVSPAARANPSITAPNNPALLCFLKKPSHRGRFAHRDEQATELLFQVRLKEGGEYEKPPHAVGDRGNCREELDQKRGDFADAAGIKRRNERGYRAASQGHD